MRYKKAGIRHKTVCEEIREQRARKGSRYRDTVWEHFTPITNNKLNDTNKSPTDRSKLTNSVPREPNENHYGLTELSNQVRTENDVSRPTKNNKYIVEEH